jgi:hypothetical protein
MRRHFLFLLTALFLLRDALTPRSAEILGTSKHYTKMPINIKKYFLEKEAAWAI